MRTSFGIRFLVLAAVLCFGIGTQAQAQSFRTHHVPQAVANGRTQFLNALPATQSMRLDIVLPLSDPAGLQTFLNELYDPASPLYRHFLSVPEFTARFGPSQADYDAVVQWATVNGLTVYGGSRDGMDVQVQGSVADIQTAFRVNMRVYQHPTENRTFYGPDREPTVGLPFPLWHISGLDNFSIPQPLYVKRSDVAKAKGVNPKTLGANATTGSGPSASFLGSDMRAAYYGGTALTGTGQNLGLLEFYGTDLTDLNTYFTNIGQTNSVPITLFSTDGTSTSCVYSGRNKCDDTEQTLDMTQAIGMAPGLTSLVMYIGNTDTAIISAMTTHSPLPSTISCSWGWTPVDPNTLNPYFERMAAQGQNFFVASGDSSTWTTRNYAWPADAAYVVSVGGTDLTTTGAGGPWASETGWADGGGGISPDKIAIPSWQQLAGVINSSNKGSTVYRNGPDVSANGNFTYYVCANQTTCTANEYGGTSFAAPLWAGYMALVNQQAVANGSPWLGFINPAIYPFGLGSSYGADFHDIASGTSGSYSAVKGYDLVTGWGSPNGTGLLSALSGLSTSPDFTISASPASVSVAQSNSGASTITTAVSGGFNSSIGLTASGQPTGVTVTFSPTSITGAGTSTMTMLVAAGAATGTYPITVTGTSGGTTHTAAVSLTVTTVPPSFTLSATTPVSVTEGSSATSTITTTGAGGFNSAVTLSASGLPSGVTATFSPASIAAPGSGTSTVTFTASSHGKVGTGTHTITITGKGGGVTQTTTISLTVVK